MIDKIFKSLNQPSYETGRSPTDVGLKNTKSGAFLRLDDTGNIRLTNRGGSVLLMDRLRGSVLLAAKYINIVSEYLNIRTRPDGLRWNGYYMNPELYAWNNAIRPDGSRLTNLVLTAIVTDDGVEKTIHLPMFVKVEKDTEFDDLLAREGIYDPSIME